MTNNGKQYIYRVGKRPQKPMKHIALFGIFTILLLIYGMQPSGVSVVLPKSVRKGGV